MIESKQKVKDLCDKLMQVNPSQIIIDLVQEDIEDVLNSEQVTPDDIGALSYDISVLIEVYNPEMTTDIKYLVDLALAIDQWEKDATFANKTLGLDPNQ